MRLLILGTGGMANQHARNFSAIKGVSVVGGADVDKHPGRDPVRDDVIPVVLHTTDGGETWENVVAPIRQQFPRGEWGWKIQVLDEKTMFDAVELIAS